VFLTQIQGFLTQKQGILTQTYFRTIFAKFCKKTDISKPNYSETCENKTFGKFRLSQGLNSGSQPFLVGGTLNIKK